MFLSRFAIAWSICQTPLEGNHRRTHEEFLEEDIKFSDEGPWLDDKTVMFEPTQFQQIRWWVLFRLNVDGLHEYYRFEFRHMFILHVY